MQLVLHPLWQRVSPRHNRNHTRYERCRRVQRVPCWLRTVGTRCRIMPAIHTQAHLHPSLETRLNNWKRSRWRNSTRSSGIHPDLQPPSHLPAHLHIHPCAGVWKTRASSSRRVTRCITRPFSSVPRATPSSTAHRRTTWRRLPHRIQGSPSLISSPCRHPRPQPRFASECPTGTRVGEFQDRLCARCCCVFESMSESESGWRAPAVSL